MKIRHILLAVLAMLAIAFLQPLITFLGGATLLLGVGALIFRDLPPVGQDAVERRVLGWLRRARGGSATESARPISSSRRISIPAVEPGLSGERPRRGRVRIAASAPLQSASDKEPPPAL